MSSPDLNQIFAERYRLETVLGKGGFATVFRATDLGSERVVAVKILTLEDGGYSPDIESRFAREVRVIAQLRDPHTVTLHDYGRSGDGMLYMVFEYIPGRDLSGLLETERQLAPSIVIHIVRQVLLSLREAHARGLLHRDIKPENIRIFEYAGDPYRVKVLDFGIARPAEQARAAVITRAGELVGTPRYMSPEQLVEETLQPASDIYSLGLVALEMLMGSDALQGRRWSDQFDRLVTGHVFSIDEHERVGPGLRAIIERMTARNAKDRYQGVDEVLRALDALTRGDSQDRPRPQVTTGERPRPQVTTGERPRPMLAAPTLIDPPYRGVSPDTTAIEPDVPFTRRLTWAHTVVPLLFVALALGVVALMVVRAETKDDDARARQTALRKMMAKNQQPSPRVESTDTGSHPDLAGLADAAPEDDVSKSVVDGGSTGCGHEAPLLGRGKITIGSALSRRTLPAYVPKNYDSTKKYPLVLLFHQDGRDGEEILDQTSLANLAEKKGFVVVAPTYWGNRLYVWRGDDDVNEINSIKDEVTERLCIDEDRIYAVGHGAGGDAVERLSCKPWLAAVATNGFRTHSPRFTCHGAEKPKPSLLISPMNSPRMLLDGGSSCIVFGERRASLKANEEKWLERNHCGSPPRETNKRANGVCFQYSCDAPFVSCHIAGGYGWPGSDVTEIDVGGQCGDRVKDYPTTETIWKFFEGLSG